jgi:hypothetical protein
MKPIYFVPVISDVIETPEQINIRLRKAIENKYNNLAFTKKARYYNKVIIMVRMAHQNINKNKMNTLTNECK